MAKRKLQSNHSFPPLGEYKTPMKKLKKKTNPLVLVRGVKRLVNARRRLQKKEIQELQEMVEKLLPKGPEREMLLQKVRRVNSLRKKAQYIIDYREKQKSEFVVRDTEFPKLLNRTFFFDKLKFTLNQPGNHSFVYLDMDRLKRVNNLLGRKEGGMELLKAYERALSKMKNKRKDSFAGHIGGDEFVLYLPMKAQEAKRFMNRFFGEILREELSKMKHYDYMRERNKQLVKKNPKTRSKLYLMYSAGIVQVPRGADLDRVEQAGDLLCKAAKKQGRNKATFAVRSNIDKFEAELKSKRKKL